MRIKYCNSPPLDNICNGQTIFKGNVVFSENIDEPGYGIQSILYPKQNKL